MEVCVGKIVYIAELVLDEMWGFVKAIESDRRRGSRRRALKAHGPTMSTTIVEHIQAKKNQAQSSQYERIVLIANIY